MALPLIGTASPRAQYTGNGSQTAFAVPFEFLANTDIEVYVDGVLKTLNTDYTLTGASVTGGGTCTFTVAPASSTVVTILGALAYSRALTRYNKFGALPANSLETDFARLQLQVKQIQRDVSFASRISPVEALSAAQMQWPSKTARAGRYAYWNPEGALEPAIPTTSVISQSTVGAVLYPQTAGELAAGITPTRYFYPAGDVRRYGADETGVASSSTAFQAAANGVSTNGGEIILPPGGVFLIDSTVTIPRGNTVVRGNGAKVQMAAGTMFACTASNITFDGVWFASTLTSSATATGAVQAYDVDNIVFDRCRFGRVLNSCRATATATRTGLRITNCLIDGVYTGSSGVDINNIFDIRGFKDVIFNDNAITAIDYYRVLKIGTAVISADPYQPLYLSGRISISNNVWNTGGSGVQQVVDLSFGTQEVVISGNVVETTGTTVPYVFHGKAANSGAGGTTPDNIVITGNAMKLGSGTDCAFYVEGNWGITGFTSEVRAVVSNNAVEGAKALAALVQIKGLNDVTVQGNVLNQASASFGRSIAVTNCKRQVIANNSIGWGSIELNGTGATQDGLSYTLSPESVVITNNIIDDFNSQGGINIFNMSALEEISIGRNHIRNQTDTGSIVSAVYFSTVTTARANIADNFANLANTAKNIVGGTLTATTLIEHDNNWNTVTATWDPASLVDGAGETSAAVTLNRAAFGDTVLVAAPYDLQGITLTGYVSAAGTVRGRLQNESGGTIDLASGTYRFILRKN